MSKMFTEMLPKTAGHASDALSSAMANMGLWEERHAELMKQLSKFSPAALEKALAAAQAEQQWINEHNKEKDKHSGKSGK